MNKLLLFILSILLFGCNNESLNNEMQNNEPIDPVLILKEINSVSLDNIDISKKIVFLEDGKIRGVSGRSQSNIYLYFFIQYYPSTGDRGIITYAPIGLETPDLLFYYNDNNILSLVQNCPGLCSSYPVTYNGSIVTIETASSYPEYFKEVLTFTDNEFSVLTKRELFYSDENNIFPDESIEYLYDSFGQIETISLSKLNTTTQVLEISKTTNFEYDTKRNPLKNKPIENPLISNGIGLNSMNLYTHANYLRMYHIGVKLYNTTKITKTSYPDNNIAIENFEYEYNEFNYPISAQKTTITNNEEYIEDITYSYYE